MLSYFVLVSSLVAGAFAAARTEAPSGAIVVGEGGDFTTIQQAVDSISSPDSVIFIQPGTYEEQVLIPDSVGALTIYGYTEDDQDYSKNQVILTHNLGADEAGNNDSSGTLRAKNTGLKVYNVNVVNSRGKGVQAIALSAYGDQQGYYGCQFSGYQDTVLSNEGHHYFHGSYIEGATDFIFGQEAIAWFESCTIGIVGKGYITASGRDSEDNPSWYVINKSTVEAAGAGDGETYLGRPWREYARVVFQNSNLGAVVNSAGWSQWGDNPTGNVYYGEFGNTGDGASGDRASFSQQLSSAVAIGDVLGSTSWIDSDYTSGTGSSEQPSSDESSPETEQPATAAPTSAAQTAEPVEEQTSQAQAAPSSAAENADPSPAQPTVPSDNVFNPGAQPTFNWGGWFPQQEVKPTTLQTVVRESEAAEVNTPVADINTPVAEVPTEAADVATSAASAPASAVPETSADDDCSGTPDGFASLNGGTTGGSGGEVVVVSTQEDLEKYAGEEGKYVIKVKGTITITPKGKEVEVTSDKTIVGIGADAEINEGGFILKSQRNVIFRNLKIGNTYVEGDEEGKTQDFDGIQMDTCENIWIDHVHLEHGGDGLIDSRKDTTFLTVSWTILRNHNKAFGIGWTDNVVTEMTIHHNYFDQTTQRNPSVDNVKHAHLYNNYLVGQTSYGHYARGSTEMRLENCYFEDVKNPIQADDTAKLSESGSVFKDTSGDTAKSTGDVFDPSEFYEYTLDAAEDVPSIVAEGAGRQASICAA
ncbi:pectinesterase [Fusarium albosuccineum]|uniref:pectinesterase n=1 Tax=Fusarium albosuccineum TaxID=1237068 RepID=A0A8H4PK84_9HYPO|nr:pectinesterase [Fusarium albosuccineum]